MPKQNLVKTWLAAIGLAPHIVETFEAAGIVNPKDLAELEVCHYPALGVKNSADRKKLFYLVQRVKLAVPDDDNSGGGGGGSGASASAISARKSGNGNGDGSGGRNAVSNHNNNDSRHHGHNDQEAHYLQQRAGEPTSVDSPSADDNEDQYADSFEIDNGLEDNDGIDEALQEQYKPLLHDSSEDDGEDDDDIDSFHSVRSDDDDFTSDEDVPSPPISPENLGLDISQTSIHTSSPSNEIEDAFLKRRSARMEKTTPPRKIRSNNSAVPRLEKSLKDTPERHGAGAGKRGGLGIIGSGRQKSPSKMRSKSPDRKALSSSQSKRTILLVKRTKSRAGQSQPKSKAPTRRETLNGLRKSKSRDENSESPKKRRSPSKTLDMEPIIVPEEPEPELDLDLDLDLDPEPEPEPIVVQPATRRSKRLQNKGFRDSDSRSTSKSLTMNSTYDYSETDGQESLGSRRSLSSQGGRSRQSALAVNSSLTGNSSDDHDLNLAESDSFGIPTPTSASSSASASASRRMSSGFSVGSGKSAKERRSKLQNPTTRENRRLSTIPSDRPSIISPFRPSSARSTDEMRGDDSASVSSRRSRTSSIGDRSMKSTSSRKSAKSRTSAKKDLPSSRAKSTPRNRNSLLDNQKAAPSNHSDSYVLSSLKQKSFDAEEKKEAPTPKSTKSSGAGSSGAVFVHGGKSGKSWLSRVAVLREGDMLQHEEDVGDCEHHRRDEEEMRIRVVVRKRPMSKKEASKKDEVDVIHPLRYPDYGRILVYQPKTRVDLTKEVETLPFSFDNVFAEDSNNYEIYEETIRPLIPGAFQGRWASVFAYGQTGSGKTFTMMGSTLTGIKAKNRNVEHEKNYGLYVLAARDIFEFASRKEYSHLTVGASLFEIYGGKLFDLLNDRAPVKCLENHKGRVCFPGLSEHPIKDAEQLMRLIEHGSTNRSTGSTSANRDSSRSHAVLQLHLRKTVGKRNNVEHGRLTFIDLAGSERGADTNKASRTTRLEGADINQSLLALKEVIRALATGDSLTHIPFRGSKLTQVLKESFVGKNSRTVMVACVAPNMTNCDHTVNTLRYADRVKERNPENGRLPDSVAAASKIETSEHNHISFPSKSPGTKNKSRDEDEGEDKNENVPDTDTDNVESDDDNWLSDLDDENGDSSDDDFDNYDEGIDELNEVLRSPVATRLSGDHFFGEDDPLESGAGQKESSKLSKKEAVVPLVTAHRSIMTEMLGMVKQEMTLVNCTDADRELIDDYLDELEAIQDQQLSMISTLRESLVHYYDQRPTDGAEGNILSDDGSFDDLRSPLR